MVTGSAAERQVIAIVNIMQQCYPGSDDEIAPPMARFPL